MVVLIGEELELTDADLGEIDRVLASTLGALLHMLASRRQVGPAAAKVREGAFSQTVAVTALAKLLQENLAQTKQGPATVEACQRQAELLAERVRIGSLKPVYPVRHQRNTSCPCGSGVKWKRCHGAPR